MWRWVLDLLHAEDEDNADEERERERYRQRHRQRQRGDRMVVVTLSRCRMTTRTTAQTRRHPRSSPSSIDYVIREEEEELAVWQSMRLRGVDRSFVTRPWRWLCSGGRT